MVTAQRLLDSLHHAGVALRFHTDFDWGGIRLGNLLMQRFSAQPWRMQAQDYEAASHLTSRIRLSGRPVTAAWDASLTAQMQRQGWAIYEESIAETLLADLREGAPSDVHHPQSRHESSRSSL